MAFTKTAGSATLFFAICLALLIGSLGQSPEIHRDAQYYLQSAILWHSGKVSFAGSWIGSRAFSVWIYHSAFKFLGHSIDSITAALSMIKFLTTIALSFSVRELISNTAHRFVSIALVSVLVFSMPLMNTPATDNLAVLFLSMIWALWLSRQHLLISSVALPFVVGVSLAVRSEIIILPALLLGTGVLFKKLEFSWRRTACSATFLLLGVISTGLLWNTWVPVEKPPQYSGAILVFRPLMDYGAATNGGESARLFFEAGQDPTARLDYWQALGATYTSLGPERSNALLTAAGTEAIMKNLPQILETAALDTFKLLDAPGSISIIQSDSQKEHQSIQQILSELDIVRLETSATFGGDFTYPTATLMHKKLDWVEAARSIAPNFTIRLELFGGIIVISLLLCGSSAIVFRDPTWLAIPLFGLSACILAAVSQGVTYRYIAPSLILNVISAAAALIALFSKSKRLHG